MRLIAAPLRPLALFVCLAVLTGCSGTALADPAQPANPGTPSATPEPWATALTIPSTPLSYTAALPNYYSTGPVAGTNNAPATNRTTDWGGTLGRVLFYDKSLSGDGTVSCASCHQAARGFSDANTRSSGIGGAQTRRHSMGLVNATFYANGRFFWDERAATLEAQVLQPIQDAGEMGQSLAGLQAKLEASPYYASLFNKAFGTTAISSDLVSRALSQFVRSIVGTQSKFDLGLAAAGGTVDPAQVAFANYTAQENLGKSVFFDPARGNCAACHGTAAFTLRAPADDGLDLVPSDSGLAATTGRPGDVGRFKVPSLRNVALRAPYMHDGRFGTLEEVVAHYSSGVQPSPNLAPQLRVPGNGAPRRPNFTPQESAALVAFLGTLTDANLAVDARWSNPFRAP